MKLTAKETMALKSIKEHFGEEDFSLEELHRYLPSISRIVLTNLYKKGMLGHTFWDEPPFYPEYDELGNPRYYYIDKKTTTFQEYMGALQDDIDRLELDNDPRSANLRTYRDNLLRLYKSGKLDYAPSYEIEALFANANPNHHYTLS